MFWKGHGSSISTGAGNIGLGGSCCPLYIRASGAMKASGLWDGWWGYSRSTPKALRAVQMVSWTCSMTLLMTGHEDTGFSAGATSGMGGWGSSSWYLLDNLEICPECIQSDPDGLSVGFWCSAFNITLQDSEATEVMANTLEGGEITDGPASKAEADSVLTGNCNTLECKQGLRGWDKGGIDGPGASNDNSDVTLVDSTRLPSTGIG